MYTTKITHADIKVDPELEKLLCPLSEDEFKALEDSIFADGLQDAVKVWINPEDGKCYLVDGHNRYTIFDKHGREIPEDKITVLDNQRYQTKDDVILYMIQFQLGRRNLSIQARYHLVEKYAPLLDSKAKENQSNGGKGLTTSAKVNVRKEKADMVGCSEGTYHKLDKIYQSDNEEIKQKVDSEEISINAGFNAVAAKDTKTDEATLDDIIAKKVGFSSGLEYKKAKEVVLKADELKANGNVKEAKILTDMLNQSVSKAFEYISNLEPHQMTTADYDKEISDIDTEIKALYEKKTKLLQDRHKAFQADNQELRCEYTEEHNATWSRYFFYLVKGEDKVDLFDFFNEVFEYDDVQFLEKIEQALKHFGYREKNPKLSKDEQSVIKAKIIGMRDIVKQDEEIRKRAKQAQDEKLNEAWRKAFGGIQQVNKIQYTEHQKEILKKVYRAGAKVLHSDINSESDEAMQLLNQLKESWGV